MKLEQIVMVILILVIVYVLLQISHQQSSKYDNIVVLRKPYFGYNFGQGPLWRGPIPGRRRLLRRRRRRFIF